MKIGMIGPEQKTGKMECVKFINFNFFGNIRVGNVENARQITERIINEYSIAIQLNDSLLNSCTNIIIYNQINT